MANLEPHPRSRHRSGCDAIDTDPAIGRATKPCNCGASVDPHVRVAIRNAEWILRLERAVELYEAALRKAAEYDDARGDPGAALEHLRALAKTAAEALREGAKLAKMEPE